MKQGREGGSAPIGIELLLHQTYERMAGSSSQSPLPTCWICQMRRICRVSNSPALTALVAPVCLSLQWPPHLTLNLAGAARPPSSPHLDCPFGPLPPPPPHTHLDRARGLRFEPVLVGNA